MVIRQTSLNYLSLALFGNYSSKMYIFVENDLIWSQFKLIYKFFRVGQFGIFKILNFYKNVLNAVNVREKLYIFLS